MIADDETSEVQQLRERVDQLEKAIAFPVAGRTIRRRFRLVLVAFAILAATMCGGVFINYNQNQDLKKHTAQIRANQRVNEIQQKQISNSQKALAQTQVQLSLNQQQAQETARALVKAVGLGALNLCLNLNQVRKDQHLPLLDCRAEQRKYQQLAGGK